LDRRLHEQAAAFVMACKTGPRTLVEPAYEDLGANDLDPDRPGLARLVADAEAGLFDEIAVTDVARLARDMGLAWRLARRLRACGVTVAVMPPTGGCEVRAADL